MLPVLLAGLIQVGFIKAGWLKKLASARLDGGLKWRGHPLFGTNKTVRGLLLMVVVGAFWAWVLDAMGWGSTYFDQFAPWLWGGLAGLGYILGELPNSFLKRQLGIGPGEAAPGGQGKLFWVIDQVDSLFGVWLVLCLLHPMPLTLLLSLVLLTMIVHPLVAGLMVCLGLKQRIG